MKKILIILPSRSCGNGREKNVQRFYENWLQTTEGESDLLVALDEDDEHFYPRIDGVIYEVNPRMRMIPTLNHIALKYKDQYEMIAFFGDDHIIKSKWETRFLNQNNFADGWAICYGNDLLQGHKLPTAVCLGSKYVQALGYMCPNFLIHLFADNFWLDLGVNLQKIEYYSDIIFEHYHPSAGKGNNDENYVESNSFYDSDGAKYAEYMNDGRFSLDIKKVQNAMDIQQ
jgi:hypothetical protein